MKNLTTKQKVLHWLYTACVITIKHNFNYISIDLQMLWQQMCIWGGSSKIYLCSTSISNYCINYCRFSTLIQKYIVVNASLITYSRKVFICKFSQLNIKDSLFLKCFFIHLEIIYWFIDCSFCLELLIIIVSREILIS